MPIERAQPDTTLELGSEPLGRVVIDGPRNVLRIGRGVVLNASMWLQGSGTVVEIEDGCHLNGMIRIVRGEGGRLRIGRGTTFNAVGISMHEAGEIDIGEDCMFSTDIHLDVSDMHPIYDRATGARTNPARPIHVGDHVWVGTRVFIGKGARIGDGAIIGGGSMVMGEIPAHSLAAGAPARVLRDDIEWRRDFDEVVTPRGPPPTPPALPRRRRWLDRLKRLGQKRRP
jgi:acetyltransferase-like isoleucine patch superfamily enzyme